MPFCDSPRLIDTDDGCRVRLADPLTYATGHRSNGYMAVYVRVPAGFTTDFASTPRWLWPIFPPRGRWNRAAIVHDYLCEHADVDRFLADAIFRAAMKELGVPLWRRVAMYYAVRVWWVSRKMMGIA